MKVLMTGNEAVARGAYEAGTRLASGYPGAPATGVMESMSKYKELYCEWSTNEKVALEVAIGSSFAGYRSFSIMKTVGLNNAADTLMFAAGSQINGGLVIVSADEAGRLHENDYNDCRFYGEHANIPILEPSDSQEAKDFTKLAFELSEEFSTPVILRLTSVTCRTKSLVNIDDDYIYSQKVNKIYDCCYNRAVFTTMMTGFNMLQGFTASHNPILKKYYNDFNGKIKDLEEKSNDMPINRLELNSREIGVISSGVAYTYVKEVLTEASVLKLGLINPLPKDLLHEISSYVKKLYVIEEGQNVLERSIKNAGISVIGEELFPKFPHITRITPDIIQEKFKPEIPTPKERKDVPFRPPMNCAGCPHLFIHRILKKNKIKASSDVNCGLIGASPHVDVFNISNCMGSSIGIAHGYNVVKNPAEKFVAVIGDGGFWHTGISGLLNLVYNAGNSTIIIVDNQCLAMTGGQSNPSSGFGFNYNSANNIDIEAICSVIGIKDIAIVDPYNYDELESAVLKAVKSDCNSIVIAKRKCIIAYKVKRSGKSKINEKVCSRCKMCLRIGCLAIEKKVEADGEVIKIDGDLCVGCKLCSNICAKGAIEYEQF